MKLLRNLFAAAALLAAPGIAAANNLGTYVAENSKYVILGSVSSSLTGGNTLDIAYSTATPTGNNTAINRILTASGSDYSALDIDPLDSIAFVQDGTVGLRANGSFSLTLTMPMAKVGSSCVPVFKGTSDASVSAFLQVEFLDGATSLETYSVNDKAVTAGNWVASCDSADSSNNFVDPSGTLVLAVSPDKTTEYSLRIDIGFETGGSFETDGDNAEQFGDNGEPIADVYTFGLQLTAS